MKKRTVKKAARPVVSPEDAVYQLKITLRGSSPLVWRRVLVPGEYLMDDLHEVIQMVMGWENCHLHQFVFRDKKSLVFVRPDEDDTDGPGFSRHTVLDSCEHTLADLAPRRKMKFIYEYDFGDSWEHEILVEDQLPAGPAAPRCLAGENAGPPEDCGGVWGYSDHLAALADPNHPDHEETKEWIGEDFDPARFDIEAVNRYLAAAF
jgi:hypothetical protein